LTLTPSFRAYIPIERFFWRTAPVQDALSFFLLPKKSRITGYANPGTIAPTYPSSCAPPPLIFSPSKDHLLLCSSPSAVSSRNFPSGDVSVKPPFYEGTVLPLPNLCPPVCRRCRFLRLPIPPIADNSPFLSTPRLERQPPPWVFCADSLLKILDLVPSLPGQP